MLTYVKIVGSYRIGFRIQSFFQHFSNYHTFTIKLVYVINRVRSGADPYSCSLRTGRPLSCWWLVMIKMGLCSPNELSWPSGEDLKKMIGFRLANFLLITRHKSPLAEVNNPQITLRSIVRSTVTLL